MFADSPIKTGFNISQLNIAFYLKTYFNTIAIFKILFEWHDFMNSPL